MWAILAVLAVVVAYFLYVQFYYRVVVRQRLGITQRSCYSRSDVHVVTALRPKEGAELKDSVAALAQQVSSFGGRVVFTGRVLSSVMSISIPEEVADRFRVLLVTQWASIEEFKAFRAGSLKLPDGPWELAWSTAWQRGITVNLLTPVLLFALRLKAAVCCRRFDITTENTKDNYERSMEPAFLQAHSWESFERICANMEQRSPSTSAPMIMWNWAKKNENKEAAAKDVAYGLVMMEMLAQKGGGVMEMGNVLSPGLEDEPWRGFEQMIGVHYPDVRFFTRLIKSSWMHQTGQGKQPGDTLALATVPWDSR